MLQEIKPYLPTTPPRRIHFFGDTEFRAVSLQRFCRCQGWHWQLGVKSDTLFHSGDGRWQPLRAIPIEPGERRYLHGVTLTQSEALAPVHLLVDWTQQTKTPRYVVSDQVTNNHSWRRGRKRFWIEPTFRDWKSYSFNLEESGITDPDGPARGLN